MNNWHSYTNYWKRKNNDGSHSYFIKVDGVEVDVSEVVYEEYSAAARKMKYMELDLKRNRVLQDAEGKAVRDENGQPVLLPEREVSLDKLISEDWDFPSSVVSPEDVVAKQLEVKALQGCLKLLDADEWESMLCSSMD